MLLAYLAIVSEKGAGSAHDRVSMNFRIEMRVHKAGPSHRNPGQQEHFKAWQGNPQNWSLRLESNQYPTLRRHVHYPLCYGEDARTAGCPGRAVAGQACNSAIATARGRPVS
jgi:hypothetical protein